MVENREIVEVQVLEEGEIFDPREFLDGLEQQWKQDPSSTPQTSTLKVFFKNVGVVNGCSSVS